MPDLWAKGQSPERDAAIRIHEMREWLERCDDDHLMWAAGAVEFYAKPPREVAENAELAWRLLCWRMQGEDMPFK